MLGEASKLRISSYPMPDENPTDSIYRVLRIPNNLRVIAAVNDVLSYLTSEGTFEAESEADEIQFRALITQMIHDYFEDTYVSIGELKPFLTSVLPGNVLLCDGAQYNQVDYPLLYEYLPNDFKSAGTFVVPDLRDKSLFGASALHPLGETGGSATHTLVVDELPVHDHAPSNAAGGDAESNAAGVGFFRVTVRTGSFNNIASTVRTGSTGGGQPHNNMPPNMRAHWGIVAK